MNLLEYWSIGEWRRHEVSSLFEVEIGLIYCVDIQNVPKSVFRVCSAGESRESFFHG
jgi:hypothetical protein